MDAANYIVTINVTNEDPSGSPSSRLETWAGFTAGGTDLGGVDAADRIGDNTTGDMVFTATSSGTTMWIRVQTRAYYSHTFTVNSITLQAA
ncbi:hypothetical protein ABVF61_00365 [Roseibium sp. HPY-6]|uniref:hypothetical protein n=1 Tax=Roseibium sp. HPY-6 TaxID=3229852 RepID=UPI00338DED50